MAKKSGNVVENVLSIRVLKEGEKQENSKIKDKMKQTQNLHIQGKLLQGAREYFESDMSKIFEQIKKGEGN